MEEAVLQRQQSLQSEVAQSININLVFFILMQEQGLFKYNMNIS